MVKTRFAPSPTGVLHIGSVRTALFCWLYARSKSGCFVLRVEDTDKERSTQKNVDAILDGLDWLGLQPDEGPFYQSDRLERYLEVIDQWLGDGHAYNCYCSKEELAALRAKQMENGEKTRYDGRCRSGTAPKEGVDPVVRFKNPTSGEVIVEDQVRGRVVFCNEELDDLIIARSNGMPTYNFTVIVDDSDMDITHVIRGDDHLNNTPRQMNMLSALGATPPVYAHLPMILGQDGAKLSKRHGAVDVREYRQQGYLPEALLNYLVRLGWSHGDQEIFSMNQMIELFDLDGINQSASAFNPEKSLWLNQQHIIAAPAEDLAKKLVTLFEKENLDVENGPALVTVIEAFRERANTLSDMVHKSRYCYEDFDVIEPKAQKKHLRPIALEPMRDVLEELSNLEKWTTESIGQAVKSIAERHNIGLGKLGQPMRVAVTGSSVSPPIDVTVYLVGRERACKRIEQAIKIITERANAG